MWLYLTLFNRILDNGGAGKTAWWLGPLLALSEDPDPHWVAHQHLLLQLQGIYCLLLASSSTCTHVAYTHRHIHVKNKLKKRKEGAGEMAEV